MNYAASRLFIHFFLVVFIAIAGLSLLPVEALAVDRQLLKVVEGIAKVHETHLVSSLTSSPPDDSLLFQVVEEVAKRLKEIMEGKKFNVPDSIKDDVNRVAKNLRKLDLDIKKKFKQGISPSVLLEAVKYAHDQSKVLVELIRAPRKASCFFHARYNAERFRTEIYVTCDSKWDHLEVQIAPGLGQTVGEIASITRGYQFGSNPDFYTLGQGSTSCTNHLSSCECLSYGAKAGGTGGMALGIYDNPGDGLEVSVRVKRGSKEIEFESFEVGGESDHG